MVGMTGTVEVGVHLVQTLGMLARLVVGEAVDFSLQGGQCFVAELNVHGNLPWVVIVCGD